MLFGALLKAGLHWRMALAPAVPVQALLALVCAYKWLATSNPALEIKSELKADAKQQSPVVDSTKTEAVSLWSQLASLDFWLMFVPKVVIFTYTQFFMSARTPTVPSASGC